jgi:solute carrier family 35, member F1/2
MTEQFYLITVVKAYQYSSITSVTLLDCWTIPWVMILTWIVLKTRYSMWQFIGAGICVVGLVLVLFSDAGVSGDGGNHIYTKWIPNYYVFFH